LNAKEREHIRALWRILLRFEPQLALTAARMTKAMLNFGFDTQRGAVQSIDECLLAACQFLGVDFDLRRHLALRVMRMEMVDKLPHFLRGPPAAVKYGVLR